MARNFLKTKVVFILLVAFLFSINSASALILTATENVTISAQVGGDSASPGGSSGSIGIPKTSVRFSGQAYPNAKVTLLKEGQEVAFVYADMSSAFTITLAEDYKSDVLFSLFAMDVTGNRSLLINYPIVVYAGYLTHLSGIRFAPTINTDKTEVRQGDYLTVSGYSSPGGNLEVVINGTEKKVFTLNSKDNGFYTTTLLLGNLSKGEYTVSSKYQDDSRISKLIKFVIGDTSILASDDTTNVPGDCNVDKVINIVDFSILAFWYGKNNPPPCVDTNKDNVINLIDFSILAFYWTG